MTKKQKNVEDLITKSETVVNHEEISEYKPSIRGIKEHVKYNKKLVRYIAIGTAGAIVIAGGIALGPFGGWNALVKKYNVIITDLAAKVETKDKELETKTNKLGKLEKECTTYKNNFETMQNTYKSAVEEHEVKEIYKDLMDKGIFYVEYHKKPASLEARVDLNGNPAKNPDNDLLCGIYVKVGRELKAIDVLGEEDMKKLKEGKINYELKETSDGYFKFIKQIKIGNAYVTQNDALDKEKSEKLKKLINSYP